MLRNTGANKSSWRLAASRLVLQRYLRGSPTWQNKIYPLVRPWQPQSQDKLVERGSKGNHIELGEKKK